MKKHCIVASILFTTLLTACGGNGGKVADVPVAPPPVPTPTPAGLVAFEPEGNVKASIVWTEYGVPHITANSLESLGFGSGYAYAKDNLCILADQIIKVRSERAKYFGPDEVAGSGDNAHILSDFGHKALQLMASAETLYPSLSENSRALIEGYVAGYNKFLNETGVDNLAPECASKPWVKEITHIDLTAYMFRVSQQSSGGRFFETAFLANPGRDKEYLPQVATAAKSPSFHGKSVINSQMDIDLPVLDNKHLGSNAWSIGKTKSEKGQGLLLANPHFPLTGSLKFWQSHITIPGFLNAAGASLQGMPGIVNIGFNDNIAWTHTVSASRRFVVFQLALNPSNNMEYVVDTEIKQIEKKTFTIEVNVDGALVPFSKDYFYSHHGLMVETPASMDLLTWDNQWAYTLKDAAEQNIALIDHWLAINLASDLQAFQQAFKDYNGIPWVNTVYSDDQGNSFYIDKSRVLSFTDSAMEKLKNDETILATRKSLGFDILPGYGKEFEPRGLNNYDQAPKLLRTDFVQNANDSYGQTNPDAPLEGFSPLYGDSDMALSLRTRMGLKMLSDSSGSDGKFNTQELESALFSNRAFLAEEVMEELLDVCQTRGNQPVQIDTLTVNISQSCSVLSQWDRRFNQDSVGAHIFREFAYPFSRFPVYQQRFVNNEQNYDVQQQSEAMSVSLAIATQNIINGGIALDARLGDIQFIEKTAPDGTHSGIKFPWAGASDITGGFNVFSAETSDETRYPIHQYTPVVDVSSGNSTASGLTEQGYHLSSGSSWVLIVDFDDQGVRANGLLMSSQSAHSNSLHADDQTRYYSDNTALRPIHFSPGDIANHTIEERVVSK